MPRNTNWPTLYENEYVTRYIDSLRTRANQLASNRPVSTPAAPPSFAEFGADIRRSQIRAAMNDLAEAQYEHATRQETQPMKKADYEVVAAVLADSKHRASFGAQKELWAYIVNMFACYFQSTHTNFNADRFFERCGVDHSERRSEDEQRARMRGGLLEARSTLAPYPTNPAPPRHPPPLGNWQEIGAGIPYHQVLGEMVGHISAEVDPATVEIDPAEEQ